MTGRITCPACHAPTPVEIPESACLYFWRCPQCRELIRPRGGDCCVFCSYGDVPCPSAES